MNWLKQHREIKNLTQEQVANLSQVSRAYYTNIERGNKRPTPEVAMRIAATLNFDWTRFYEDTETETIPN